MTHTPTTNPHKTCPPVHEHHKNRNETDAFYARLFAQNERVIKLGLDAMHQALAREPQLVNYPHILVAGTNGKGQVSALFSNAVQSLGLLPGLYTSPHLVDFRERIRVGGHMIPVSEMVAIGRRVLSEYGGDDNPDFSGLTLTYFECCLIMALRFFRRSNIQFGVFEVGLGGRLDATNVLSPSMSIITSIGHDHEQYLGHTLEAIAHEKAGIMRKGCPVVVGRTCVETLRREALEHGCSAFHALGVDFDWRCDDDGFRLVTDDDTIPMQGGEELARFQRDNAAVAAFALLSAARMGWFKGNVREVLRNLIVQTKWVGRMWPCSETTARALRVSHLIMDGAHNPDGVESFCNAVPTKAPRRTTRALVVNSCGDKDIEAMFPRYLDVFDPERIFVSPITSSPRGCSPSDYCTRTGLEPSRACASLDEAIRRAAQAVGEDGTIFISGSLYLIGDAIRCLGETSNLESVRTMSDEPALHVRG